MNLADFDYHLPPELIAQNPAGQRDQSRLMVLDRDRNETEHVLFCDLARYIRPGDVLVANDTRVIPARVYAHKPTGGRVELLLLQFMQAPEPGVQQWQCLTRSHRPLRLPQELVCEGGMRAIVRERTQEKMWVVDLHYEGAFEEALQSAGRPPLPPYITREPEKPATSSSSRCEETGCLRPSDVIIIVSPVSRNPIFLSTRPETGLSMKYPAVTLAAPISLIANRAIASAISLATPSPR